MLKLYEPLGQTKAGPLITPGTVGVLLMLMVFVGLLYPQLIDAYTLNVPLVQPGRKLTVTLVDVPVKVLVPPLIVAAPVIVQV